MFTLKDLQQIKSHGVLLEKVSADIKRFQTGFPKLKIKSPATTEKGIIQINKKDSEACIEYLKNAEIRGMAKFVPASGAASRMFKDMFSALDMLTSGKSLPEGSPGEILCENIDEFAFYDEKLFKKHGNGTNSKEILTSLLTASGLNYGAKPKGVILFHKYENEVRTAFEEHLVEAQDYLRDKENNVNIVVTISEEHLGLFESLWNKVKPEYEKRYGVKYNVTFTFQDSSTDTPAVNPDNTPFRTKEGKLLFRPAGHGALIHNLNELKEELISIKNIDNVVHEKLLPVTSFYKKVLMGKALEVRDTVYRHLNTLDSALQGEEDACDKLCEEIETFIDTVFCITFSDKKYGYERAKRLKTKLDRPIRICGMVKNEGEPGGGPFIIEEKDNSTGLQILESVQIDPGDESHVQAVKKSSHFNPVDIICCTYNYKGKKFNLLNHVDAETGFISQKSHEGKELKAMELPGLWNGAMSDWNTCFVEVPVETFNPVKVVLDLLKPAHRQ